MADFTEDNLEADLLAQFEELRAIVCTRFAPSCFNTSADLFEVPESTVPYLPHIRFTRGCTPSEPEDKAER